MVAVDGPGGVGKSTVSRRVAEALGLPVLDTGALYRAATLAVVRAGIDPDEPARVGDLVRTVGVGFEEGRTFLDGSEVTEEVRSAEVTAAVSAVSAIPEVRRILVDLQRRWVRGRGGSAVVEGRDIGTVVFPGAAVKVFLTARPEVRAARRARQEGGSLEDVVQDLIRRDDADAGRATSPLRAAEEAVVIDTSDLGIDEVVERILSLVPGRLR